MLRAGPGEEETKRKSLKTGSSTNLDGRELHRAHNKNRRQPPKRRRKIKMKNLIEPKKKGRGNEDSTVALITWDY